MPTKIQSLILSILFFVPNVFPMQRYRQAAQLVAAQKTSQQRVLNRYAETPKLKVEETQFYPVIYATGAFGGTIVAKVIKVATVAGAATASALVFDYIWDRDSKKSLSSQEKEIRRKTRELKERATRDLRCLLDCDGYLGPITQITNQNVELYLIENRHKEPIKSLLAQFAAADAELPAPNYDDPVPPGKVRRRTRGAPVVRYSEAAQKARTEATARGEVLPSYRLRFNESTLTIDLLPKNPDYEAILAAEEPKNPNGLYVVRGPQHKLPLAGQKALDEAVWFQNKLWGVENGRLIFFIKNIPGTFDGHFYDNRHGTVPRVLAEQTRRRNERNAYWAKRIAEMVAVEAREDATPQDLLDTVRTRTEEEKKEDEADRAELERRRPNGTYQALEGQPVLENGQAILNEAIWDPTSRRLYGFAEDGSLVIFAPQNQATVANLSSAVAQGLASFVIHRQKENRKFRRYVRSLSTERVTDFVLDNHHPNGLYVPATGKPATALPQQGQMALDGAVIEYSTGNLWGIEGDRLILFTYRSKLEGPIITFQYEGAFHEGDAPEGMLELVRRGRQEVDRIRKSAGDRPQRSITPPSVPQVHPYGLYHFVHFEGQRIRDGQRVLDGAVWDPIHKQLLSIEDNEVVSFSPITFGGVHEKFKWQGRYIDKRQSLCTFARELKLRLQRAADVYNGLIQKTLADIRQFGPAAQINILELARIMDSYHPNGLYIGEVGADNLPQYGQEALDDAVLEPKTGYFWGVENDRLIRFEFIGERNGDPYLFTYTGSFYEGDAPAGILKLAQVKKKKADTIKDTISNRPRPPENSVPAAIPEHHPYGLYNFATSGGENIPNGQQVLDEAVWHPMSGQLWGLVEDRLVTFVRRNVENPNEHFYQGVAVAETIPAHATIKELVRNKQQEVRAYKDRITTMTAANSELDVKQRKEAVEELEAYQPHGVYVAGRNIPGRMPQDGQAALNDAVPDPAGGRLWGVEGDRLILFNFIPSSNTLQYEGYYVNENLPAILALAKNKRNKEQARRQAIRVAGTTTTPRGPDEDEKCERHIYEGNPKHHPNSRGNISRPPREGQKVLDSSIRISPTLRVGVEDGKLIIFRRHNPCTYHGYISENINNDLNDSARNILKEAGWISNTGKILRK